jgi:hypothetical protein
MVRVVLRASTSRRTPWTPLVVAGGGGLLLWRTGIVRKHRERGGRPGITGCIVPPQKTSAAAKGNQTARRSWPFPKAKRRHLARILPQLAGCGEPTMTIDRTGAFRDRLSESKPASRSAVSLGSADCAMGESRRRQADQFSAFQSDEPEYLDALRIEFKRRVRDQNCR